MRNSAAHGTSAPTSFSTRRRIGEFGRAAGGVRFEQLAQIRDAAGLGHVDDRGERATTRVRDDEVVGLQALERLAHRGAPDAELGGDRDVVDRLARADVEHDETVLEPAVGEVGEGDGGAALVVVGGQQVDAHGVSLSCGWAG
jgi:hypothetical protein